MQCETVDQLNMWLHQFFHVVPGPAYAYFEMPCNWGIQRCTYTTLALSAYGTREVWEKPLVQCFQRTFEVALKELAMKCWHRSLQLMIEDGIKPLLFVRRHLQIERARKRLLLSMRVVIPGATFNDPVVKQEGDLPHVING